MTREEALQILDTIPTISEQVDALEMAIQALSQEKSGEWKREEFPNFTVAWFCNKCGRGSYRKSNYCPNCGADMRGAE